MIYRRILPIAAGAVVLAGGFLSLSKPSFGSRYSGRHLDDSGLKNYTFIDTKKYELLNATVFLRHGARTPNYFVDSKFEMPDWESGLGYVDMLPELDFDTDVSELPSKKLIDEDTIMDEYIERVKGKCQYGQLTLVGQEQSIAFGKELRRIYIDGYKLIHQDFNENEIFCRSTKFPRTFYTLKGILAGVYGCKAFDICHRPIIHTMAVDLDPLYPNSVLCPVIGQFIVNGSAEISKDQEIIKMKCLLRGILGVDSLRFSSPDKKGSRDTKSCESRKAQAKEGADQKTQEPITEDKVTIYAVRDDFFSRQVHDFTVPGEFPVLLPEINRLSSEEILYEYLGGSGEWEDRIALLVSPAMNIMKRGMQTAIDNSGVQDVKKGCVADMKEALLKKKKTMKMQLVSCHDTSLIPMLVCLRIYDGQWPSFMANLIVELHREKCSDELFVRLIFNGKVQHPRMSQETCALDNDHLRAGLIPYMDFLKFADAYSFPDEKYSSACDKVMKLVTSGKPVTRDQFV